MQVSELEDFDTLSSLTGIKNWRTILCASNQVLLSQTGSSDLIYKLDQEPALKYAITGDQSITITPTLLPPSQKSVEEWNKGRALYKQLKRQTDKIQEKVTIKINDEDTETKDNATKESESDSNLDTAKDKTSKTTDKDETRGKRLVQKYRLNLFTGKRELMEVDDSSDSQKSSQEDSGKRNSQNTDKASPTDGNEDIVKSNESVVDTDILHSTPVMRKDSTELFELECTPIASGSGESGSQEEDVIPGSQEKVEQGFVTPKRIRPLRRLSTNTDKALRRALLSTQVKVRKPV